MTAVELDLFHSIEIPVNAIKLLRGFGGFQVVLLPGHQYRCLPKISILSNNITNMDIVTSLSPSLSVSLALSSIYFSLFSLVLSRFPPSFSFVFALSLLSLSHCLSFSLRSVSTSLFLSLFYIFLHLSPTVSLFFSPFCLFLHLSLFLTVTSFFVLSVAFSGRASFFPNLFEREPEFC